MSGTDRSTWKKFEQRVARFFGSRRGIRKQLRRRLGIIDDIGEPGLGLKGNHDCI